MSSWHKCCYYTLSHFMIEHSLTMSMMSIDHLWEGVVKYFIFLQPIGLASENCISLVVWQSLLGVKTQSNDINFGRAILWKTPNLQCSFSHDDVVAASTTGFFELLPSPKQPVKDNRGIVSDWLPETEQKSYIRDIELQWTCNVP